MKKCKKSSNSLDPFLIEISRAGLQQWLKLNKIQGNRSCNIGPNNMAEAKIGD